MRYMVICHDIYFFFFKQKSAYDMRISDWSSDVCSSDLLTARKGEPIPAPPAGQQHKRAGTRGRTSPPEPCQWRFFQFPQPFSNGADRPAQPPCPPGSTERKSGG